jgi:ATP-dependent helicase HrpA
VPASISQLLKLTSTCLARDQHAFRRQLHSLERQSGSEADKRLEVLEAKIAESAASVERRRQTVPTISYPPELPLAGKVEDIKRALTGNQVVIVAGETGSGKTTQLPKICLEMGRGIHGMIGHTQPRRLAARSVCSRIGEELGVMNTSAVAYQVRFQDYTDDNTYIKLMTDGILLSETRDDPFLNKYDTIIIDEAHERSLNIDFLLGYLKRLLPRRKDLKLIVTSATIDVEKFSSHFDDAPIIEVSGRTYPVTLLYRPPQDTGDDNLNDQIIRAIQEIRTLDRKKPIPHRDILVFLSGEKEIRDAADAIRRNKSLDLDVLPLYARLSNREQNRVFQGHSGQRVILATNVAETSLTVPGIGYVIDPGLARISRYSVRSKIQRLPIEPVSQASANQRAGRCGRLCPGTCIRLYSEEDFDNRPAFTDTEITRTNLASVILQMLVFKLGDIANFPFVEPPDSNAVRDGFRLLEELGAVTPAGQIKQRGSQMARFPVDPRLARILLAGAEFHCLHEILIIISALSIQDPRERPLDKQQAADEAHARYHHPESDFLSWTALWEFFDSRRQELTRNRLGKFCHQHFLSYLRMREWRDVHRQLHLAAQELKLSENTEPASFEQVHQALLSGLVSNVANRLDDNTYLGARNRKFRVFPGSNLHGKKFPWILAAELVETTQLYARMNARIEPAWIEKQAGYLLKYQYAEPHWEKQPGRVMVSEKVTLYGLVLVEKRKVPYAKIDPVASREIFIREGLVASEVNTTLAFYRHNTALCREIENLEDRTRRKDILVRDEDLYRLYDPLIPAEVNDQTSLERWYRQLKPAQAARLLFSREDLVRQGADALRLEDFPDQILAGHLTLDLDYQFEPGQSADGVSVNVPVSALMQLQEEELDWLVPGMLREKCIALLKALPKPLRKHFVPVPDYVDRLLPAISRGDGDLKSVLAHQLQRLTGRAISLDNWNDFALPDHMRMRINVIDDSGRRLGEGRELAALKQQFAGASQKAMAQLSQSTVEQTRLTDWTFDRLEHEQTLIHGSLKLKSWPALVDEGDSVALRLLDSPYKAKLNTRAGVVRLYILRNRQLHKHLQKNLLQDATRLPAMKPFGGRDALAEDLIMGCYQSAFRLFDYLPASRADFDFIYEEGRARLIETSEKLESLLYRILSSHAGIIKELKKINAPADLILQQDVSAQVDALVHKGFLAQTSVEQLREYPRYFQAIEQRLEKYPRQRVKDSQWSNLMQVWWQRYHEKCQLFHNQHKSSQALESFRWMLEELRVSLFAQALGTRYPISEKRLEKAWQDIT